MSIFAHRDEKDSNSKRKIALIQMWLKMTMTIGRKPVLEVTGIAIYANY